MDSLFRIIPLTLIAISIFLIRIYMMNKSTTTTTIAAISPPTQAAAENKFII